MPLKPCSAGGSKARCTARRSTENRPRLGHHGAGAAENQLSRLSPSHPGAAFLGAFDSSDRRVPWDRSESARPARARVVVARANGGCCGDDPEGKSMNAAPLPVNRVHRCAAGRAGALGEPTSDGRRGLLRNEL
ncbi:hypothetical protein DBV15_04172 [Temnothorax longispinosus]|uniref:Uncharacterized protein n=1 Tax=Temnothorax longispinosus TaxID=300112 RepID=A0A4S2KD63_9HYME|nr:hypothetical protein DBV15_04172 [Temnothorax longispinosus]